MVNRNAWVTGKGSFTPVIPVAEIEDDKQGLEAALTPGHEGQRARALRALVPRLADKVFAQRL